MKIDNHFAIKINAERILIATLFVLSIIFIYLLVKQNSEIKQLKTEITIQLGQNEILERKVDEVEDQSSDLENNVSDLEGRIDDLERNSNY